MSLSEVKVNTVIMDPHKQQFKADLALERGLAVLNNQIKHFLVTSWLKKTSAQMCSLPLKSQLLLQQKD